MAAEGKLTTDVLLKAFREMGPAIEKEFANTTQTMSQSLQIASNNITKFFGENTTVKTFTRIFNDSVVTISENLDGLTAVLTVAATVIGSRFAGAMALAAKEKMQHRHCFTSARERRRRETTPIIWRIALIP